jgi:hypothetical protein
LARCVVAEAVVADVPVASCAVDARCDDGDPIACCTPLAAATVVVAADDGDGDGDGDGAGVGTCGADVVIAWSPEARGGIGRDKDFDETTDMARSVPDAVGARKRRSPSGSGRAITLRARGQTRRTAAAMGALLPCVRGGNDDEMGQRPADETDRQVERARRS